MTVTTTTSSQTFQGNGSAKAFPCAFEIFQNTDVEVFFVNPITGVQTPALLNSDYTITGAGASNGFTVNTTVPVPTGTNLYVERVLPFTQPTDFTNQGAFFPPLHQAAIDRLCMLIQQVANLTGLNISLPPGLYPEPSNVFPAPAANQLIGWNGDGTALENIPPSDGGVTLFSQPATGATSRAIISKVQETVSITDFMTAAQIADSQTGTAPTLDCSAAMQAAVNYAELNGKKLVLPPGRYLCSNITLNNVALEGTAVIDQGYDSGTIGNLARGGTQFYVTDTSHSLFIVQSGCMLSGFNVYYPNQTGAAFTAKGNAPTVYPPALSIPTNCENIHISDIGSVNCYQFIKIGTINNTNAVGRITLKNLRVYSIFCDIEVHVLRDILQLENCVFTYGWWNQTQAGSIAADATIPNLATWTARNGISVILDTTDGINAVNCFWFCKNAVLQAYSGGESTSAPGQSQYNHFTNCLFDGCATMVQSENGGYYAGTVFTNCTFADLSPNGYPGSYPFSGAFRNDSTVVATGSVTFNGCEFIGSRGFMALLNNSSYSWFKFNGCDFNSWVRYSGAIGTVNAAVYIGGSADVLFNGCRFDAAGGFANAAVAIDIEGSGNISIVGCQIKNCSTPINVGNTATGNVTIAGLTTQGTTNTIAVNVGASFAGKLALGAGCVFDKPPQKWGNDDRCKVCASGTSLGSIGAGPTAITFSSETVDTNGAFTPSTGTFVAPYKGLYRCGLTIAHGTNVTVGDVWKLSVVVNGITRCSRLYQVAAANYGSHGIGADVALNSGDSLLFTMTRQAGTGNFPPVTGDSTFCDVNIAVVD